jgi:hypothetical protein
MVVIENLALIENLCSWRINVFWGLLLFQFARGKADDLTIRIAEREDQSPGVGIARAFFFGEGDADIFDRFEGMAFGLQVLDGLSPVHRSVADAILGHLIGIERWRSAK